MWTVEKITDICKELSKQMGDEFNIPCHINTRLKTTLGYMKFRTGGTYYRPKDVPICIDISKQMIDTCDDETIEETIKHEWVHYYVCKTTGQNHNHDAVFKKYCRIVGCTHNTATTKVNRVVAKPTTKYEVKCLDCNKVIAHYSRTCKTLQNIQLCSCKNCGGHNLKVIQNW